MSSADAQELGAGDGRGAGALVPIRSPSTGREGLPEKQIMGRNAGRAQGVEIMRVGAGEGLIYEADGSSAPPQHGHG